jgi:hypothetical protein
MMFQTANSQNTSIRCNRFIVYTQGKTTYTSSLKDGLLINLLMNYPAAEQRGIYKGIVTPQSAGN